MSLVGESGPPPVRTGVPVVRRRRPRGRNEILAGGRLGGHDPAALATRFGTPFYVYDLDVITRQVDALRAALPGVVDLAFAAKANPNLAVLQHLAATGLGADVASGGELRHALRAGFESSRIVFTGPGKRDEELRAAVDAGIRVVTVESPGELRRLASIAGSLGRSQPVLLRAAVSEAPNERVRLVGDHGAGKFGMDVADLAAAAAEAVASPWLEPLGIHAFGASNVTDSAALAAHVEATVVTAIEVATAVGFTLRLVDAGGGLGIPYARHDDELDIQALGARLRAVAGQLAAAPTSAPDARILLEPGRFLVGASGAYVARVVDRKTVGGQHVVILDGGIHHVLRPALVGQEHRVRLLTGVAASQSADSAGTGRFPVTVAGPLCSGLDVFARNEALALPDVGDLVGVLDVGAYGATESMPFFLSHPLPPEVALRGGQAWISRPRVEPDAWLEWQTGGPPAG